MHIVDHLIMVMQPKNAFVSRCPTTQKRKPLGVRVTPEQHAVLTEAARRQHRSVSSFVLQSALATAEQSLPAPKPRKSLEEIRSILDAARAEVRQAIPEGEDFLEDFFTERRRWAAHE